MFRAGDTGGAAPGLAARAAIAAAVAPVTLCADVSEYQPDIADHIYLKWSQAIIIRCAYGTNHDDRAWYGGDRRAQLHKHGVKFLGIYIYLRASQDPVAQAGTVIRLVGAMQPGEKIICDLEEGTGNQQPRWVAFRNRIKAELGDTPWLYSGLFFARDHGLTAVDWIAAYQAAEPAVPHKLWQFTSSYTVPGIPGKTDCSRFHGTADQLAALAWQPATAAKAFAAPPNLRAGKARVSLPVSWDPVTLAGKQPASYTVAAYGLDGNRYAIKTATGTTCVLDGLNPGWTYKIRVWANGGPVAPPHSEIRISV